MGVREGADGGGGCELNGGRSLEEKDFADWRRRISPEVGPEGRSLLSYKTSDWTFTRQRLKGRGWGRLDGLRSKEKVRACTHQSSPSAREARPSALSQPRRSSSVSAARTYVLMPGCSACGERQLGPGRWRPLKRRMPRTLVKTFNSNDGCSNDCPHCLAP